MNIEHQRYQSAVKRPALVMGANGFMGSHTVRQLLAEGREVRVLVRKTSTLTPLEGLAVEKHLGDVSDIESLQDAMQGCGSVFYNVVDTRAWLDDPAPLYRCNVEGLKNALDAAMASGVERFLFTSSMATIGLNPDGPATELDTFNWWDKAPHYIRSRVKAENLFMEYCKNGLSGAAMCVANTYGPKDYQPTPHGKLLWEAANGKMPIALKCGAPVVDIRDAAKAALLAEQYARDGERYIVANRFATQPELFSLGAKIYGNKPPRALSLNVIYSIAWANEIFARILRRKDVKLRPDTVFLSEVFGDMSNVKICQELGWQPRPLERTVEDAIHWFADYRKQLHADKASV